jgi:hypothetical protein
MGQHLTVLWLQVRGWSPGMAGGSKTNRRLAGVEVVRTEFELFTAGAALLGQRPESGHSDPQVSSAVLRTLSIRLICQTLRTANFLAKFTRILGTQRCIKSCFDDRS